ncbi:hypothetical protein DFQ27_009695 [Actinomortierella ambigua]|uniref:Protein kinase domain-containing protein n=1 Tax=Actinomortierella ambigua TaxID=1343610 RepID=A0A9P6TX45_9FUNG|nr:hypothetical protein DFQ27_009695 [Actinomortierella ambigua]
MSLKLGKCVGEGGFGAVYIGMWHGQRCAVKRFYLREQDKLIKQEISHVKNLRHRHIIQFLAAETYEGSLVMITDFAEGGTLQSAIQGKRLGDGWVKKDQISKEIAKGLAYIHSNKIIHRDLKSGNVLLTQYLEVKLCDFGLAQIKINTASSHTSDRGSAEGTLRWMAPEVLALRPKYSTKSDMYALGMVMWEMAANCTTPFQYQRDNNVVIGFVRQGEREEIPEEAPMYYKSWIERCWEQDPSKRPEAADMFDENIDDVGYASGSQASTVSVTMSMSNLSVSTGESRSPGGSGSNGVNKFAARRGLPAYLAVELSKLEGEYADRATEMLSLFEDTSHYVPPPVVEELELMVTPVNQLLRDATQGQAESQYKLGRKYFQALGVEPDYGEAARLLGLAAASGHAEARYQYAQVVHLKEHALFDEGKAEIWLKQAAADGHALAKTLLYVVSKINDTVKEDNFAQHSRFLQKLDVKGDVMASYGLAILHFLFPPFKDIDIAIHYFERAAMRGLVESTFALASIYEEGEDVAPDLTKARQLHAHTASRWYVGGQYMLGMMLKDGRGGPRDRHKAAMLLRNSAQQGHPESEEALREMNL